METGKPWPLFLEFRAQPADALGAGANVPAQSPADELVLLFTFQAEAANFLIKLAEFGGFLPPFGHACGQGVTLAAMDAGAMQFGDGISPVAPLRVE